MSIEDKMVEFGLRYVQYTGNHPYQSGYIQKIHWAIWVPGAIYGFVLTYIGFCKVNGDIELVAKKAEGFLAQFQVKCFCLQPDLKALVLLLLLVLKLYDFVKS